MKSLILAVLIGLLMATGWAAAEWIKKYNCPDALWSGPIELPDHKKTVQLGFCSDGIVLWKDVETN